MKASVMGKRGFNPCRMDAKEVGWKGQGKSKPDQMTDNRRNEKMKKVWIGLLIVA